MTLYKKTEKRKRCYKMELNMSEKNEFMAEFYEFLEFKKQKESQTKIVSEPYEILDLEFQRPIAEKLNQESLKDLKYNDKTVSTNKKFKGYVDTDNQCKRY